MARRRREYRRRRNAIPSLSLMLALSPLEASFSMPPVSPIISGDLRDFEDRRRFVPNRLSRAAVALPRAAARLVVGSPRFRTRLRSLPATVAFAAPKRVVLCVRRQRRREVLLAKGRGGSGHRRPRRNAFSDVEC